MLAGVLPSDWFLVPACKMAVEHQHEFDLGYALVLPGKWHLTLRSTTAQVRALRGRGNDRQKHDLVDPLQHS